MPPIARPRTLLQSSRYAVWGLSFLSHPPSFDLLLNSVWYRSTSANFGVFEVPLNPVIETGTFTEPVLVVPLFVERWGHNPVSLADRQFHHAKPTVTRYSGCGPDPRLEYERIRSAPASKVVSITVTSGNQSQSQGLASAGPGAPPPPGRSSRSSEPHLPSLRQYR